MTKKIHRSPKKKMDVEKALQQIGGSLQITDPILRQKTLARCRPVLDRFFPIPEETEEIHILPGLSSEQIGAIKSEMKRIRAAFQERYREMLVEICVLTAALVCLEERDYSCSEK